MTPTESKNWHCTPCNKDYPPEYPEDYCETCGGVLMRVVLNLPLARGSTCPHGVNTDLPCQMCANEIRYGMLQWEPGTLDTVTVRRILSDVLADLWQDAWRSGERNSVERAQRFARVLETMTFTATGEHWSVKRR